MTTYEPPAEATTEPRVRWCDRDDAHPAHERRNHFGGKDYCTGMSEEAAARGRPSQPAPAAEHPCGDYPAPCNCDDPETHDGAVPATERDELRAEVERLREVSAAQPYETERELAVALDEARQQLADLRAGVEALLPGETVNVYAGGGNLVSQRRVVDPDHLRALLAGSGERSGEAVCLTGDATGLDGWCVHVGFRHRSGTPAPVVPDVVRELDAVMHHHADRADAAEAEVDRLAALLDVAQEDLAAAEAPAVPDSADMRERVRRALAGAVVDSEPVNAYASRPITFGEGASGALLDDLTDAVLAAVSQGVTDCNCGFGGQHDPANPRCRANRDVVRPRGQEGS